VRDVELFSERLCFGRCHFFFWDEEEDGRSKAEALLIHRPLEIGAAINPDASSRSQ
jgi:hypothetical protein